MDTDVVSSVPDENESNNIVVDMTAQIRTITSQNAKTYEAFADIFIRSIPRDYNRVDLVSDTYKD